MVKLIRTEISYGALRKERLEALRHWPGCETIAEIQVIRDNTVAGFSVKITLYGKATKGSPTGRSLTSKGKSGDDFA